MAKDLLDLILDPILESIFTDEFKGRHGEKLTEKKLKRVSLFGRKGRILRNVYLPKDDGTTSEVDVLFITQKGIFVIESKNYSGWIFGDEKGKYWTAMLANKTKNQFYNPILQNKSHIKWMANYVGPDIPLFSLIVFSERCELKKVNLISEDLYVIKRDKVYATVKQIWDKSRDALQDSQVEELFTQLEKLTNVDEAIKTAHIENIEKNYKRTDSNKNVEDVNETMPSETSKTESVGNLAVGEKKICPQCGAELVLRTAKKGSNAGNKFWGCSSFPKCKYILDK